jgi:hypothetical protein
VKEIPDAIEPGGMFSGLKAWPIFAGVITDIVSTYILGTILLFIILFKRYGPEIPEEAFQNVALMDNNLLWFAFLGTVCTVIGGYVGSRMAGSEEIRHGGWVGALSLIFSVYLQLNTESDQVYPQWFTIISVALVIPAGVLGGYIAKSMRKNSHV